MTILQVLIATIRLAGILIIVVAAIAIARELLNPNPGAKQ